MSELDRRVAIEVMGWELPEYIDDETWDDGPACAIDGLPYRHNEDHSDMEPFSPSTDIADAWRVVERMRELGIGCKVDLYPSKPRPGGKDRLWISDSEAMFVDPESGICYGRHIDKSAPEAICEAALQAVAALREEG